MVFLTNTRELELKIFQTRNLKDINQASIQICRQNSDGKNHMLFQCLLLVKFCDP